MINENNISSTPQLSCALCGSSGDFLYQGLGDRLFGVHGLWNLRKCNNNACGLVWLDPMPGREDISKAYINYYTHINHEFAKNWLNRLNDMAVEGYLNLVYGYPVAGLEWIKRVLGILFFLLPGRKCDADFSVMWLQNMPGGRLLDVGCGSGDMLQRMQNRGWNVQGLDFDPQAVEAARKKGLNIKLGSFSEQDFPSDSFDVVTMSHVFEHVHDSLALLEFCKRVLKPGGRLILLTPNNESLLHRIYGENWKPLEPPRHLYLFNSRTVATLAEKAGFGCVAVTTIIRDANGIFAGSRSLKKTGGCDTQHFQPVLVRLCAKWVQLIEWGIHLHFKRSGEELLLIAKK